MLVVLSTTAIAADMTPVFKTLPNDSAARDWAGVYGRMSTSQSWNGITNDGTLHGAPFTSTLTPGNFIGGGQFGYNMQMGPLVFGIESDINWRRGVSGPVHDGLARREAPSPGPPLPLIPGLVRGSGVQRRCRAGGPSERDSAAW